MKLVKVGFKKPVIQVDNNGKLIWMNCVDSKEHNTTGQGLYEYIKKNFKQGDEINPEYTEEKGNYYCTRVSKSSAPVSQPKPEVKKEEPKSESVKSSDIIKAPEKIENEIKYEYPRGYMSPMTPEASAQIKHLSLVGSTGQIVQGMLVNQQGAINGNSLIEITKTYIKEVYKALKEVE